MFFGSGGFPFAGMGGMGRPEKEVDNETFYKTLGVEKTASVDEIKRSFKKLAIKHHPDKGGDPETFKEICRAYEVLSDPEKRRAYDQYGEEGVAGGGATDATDIFEMFFGGGGRRRGPVKGEDVVSPVDFTLEQFFNGATRKMAITRNAICQACQGRGGPEDAFIECSECRGMGVKVVVRRVGPMISQSQSPCSACKATGKYIPDSKRCSSCDGRGVLKEKKVLEIHLDKGAPENHKVVFSGQADEKPGEIAGDVIFVCRQKPHAVFTRAGVDLTMTKKISLAEALTGVAFYVEHLDGERKFIETSAGRIVKPDEVLCVESQGMPKHGAIFVRGNLFIKFEVLFPDQLSSKQRQNLLANLPTPVRPVTRPAADSDMEILQLKSVDPEILRQQQQQQMEEEDEMHGGGQNVQCRQA